jgi:hypothetical protein
MHTCTSTSLLRDKNAIPITSVEGLHHFYAAPASGPAPCKNFGELGELALSYNVVTDKLVY